MVHFTASPGSDGAPPSNQQQFGEVNSKNPYHRWRQEWKPQLRHHHSQWQKGQQHHWKQQKYSWQKQNTPSWKQPPKWEADPEETEPVTEDMTSATLKDATSTSNASVSNGAVAGQELLALMRATKEATCMTDKEEDTAASCHSGDSTEASSQSCGHDGMIEDASAWSTTDAAAQVSEGSPYDSYDLSCELPPELWALLECDETLQGPDGDLYDIFYPDVTAKSPGPENLSVVTMSPGEKPLQCKDIDNWSSSPLSRKLVRASSAEDCLEDLIHEMHHAVLQRHPAKQHLFSAIHTAAETALGNAFARLALVGSTAMQIDTPASDLDVVVFTRPMEDALQGVDALRWIAAALRGIEPSLRLELIDCAKVPILIATTADGALSIDVSVDQPLAESHVLWFQMQHEELPCQGPLHRVPTPAATKEWGLAATLCRVLKWWLCRRGIPCAKEGGYPSLVWLLMAMHSLRCSLFVDQADAAAGRPHGLRSLLGALAAFFDRFSRPSGFWGAIVFAHGTHSEFWLHRKALEGAGPSEDGAQAGRKNRTPSSLPIFADFAVFDPARSEPADLAVRMSPATWMLFAFELRRAAHFTASALSSMSSQSGKSTGKVSGRIALHELFANMGTGKMNTLPSALPPEASADDESYRPLAGIFLTNDDGEASPRLQIGIVSAIKPNTGWSAPFLHRRDPYSHVHVTFCDLYGDTLCVPGEQLQILRPYDFVCGVQLRPLDRARKVFEMAEADVERLQGMGSLLSEESV